MKKGVYLFKNTNKCLYLNREIRFNTRQSITQIGLVRFFEN